MSYYYLVKAKELPPTTWTDVLEVSLLVIALAIVAVVLSWLSDRFYF